MQHRFLALHGLSSFGNDGTGSGTLCTARHAFATFSLLSMFAMPLYVVIIHVPTAIEVAYRLNDEDNCPPIGSLTEPDPQNNSLQDVCRSRGYPS